MHMHLHNPQGFRDIAAGDAVDQVEADLVVLSAEAVHSKRVDSNLLAEFCTAPGKVHLPRLSYIHAFKGVGPSLQSDLQRTTVCW